MEFFKKLLDALVIILGLGGFVSAVILAITAHAWIPLVGIGVLGWMAWPSLKQWVKKLSSL